ncbi:NAD(P)-binding domain-containing protein [Roseococcus sp. YIM B11640]|uniref:NAD(P)-binding domain-containing protein n=1 Tax=Roseococcus sp. YIM B11640 TaxID=3133973 RepID=UPI003C7C37BA
MRVGILGAGPAGSAMAGLLAYRGHDVALWSPRGGGTRHLGDRLRTRGAFEGHWKIRIAADLGRAVEGADALLVAMPGHVIPPLLHRLAAVLVGAPDVFLAPPGALAPLLLRDLVAARGLTPRIGALPVPPLAARREPGGGLHVAAVRPRLWLGALAPVEQAALMARLDGLFGLPVEPLAGVLGAALAEPAPLIGAARLLAPPGLAHAVGRLVLGLAAERDAMARAMGCGALPPILKLIEEQGGLPEATPSLEETAAGLAFLDGLARAAHKPAPLAAAALRLLEAASGSALSPHPVMRELDPRSLAAALGF